MKNNYRKSSRRRKQKIEKRLENVNEFRTMPMFDFKGIRLELSEKISAMNFGGIALINEIVKIMGLQKLIDENLKLFKIHNPYFESDHILNMVYNIICGGTCLEDIERLRNDLAYTDSLGAKRIPDPTTAGDFLRRFDTPEKIEDLMTICNQANQIIWNASVKKKKDDAILDVDGTIQEIFGECKEGIGLSYNGKWGFSPLVITEATTGVHLYTVNRSGNKVSHDNCVYWINKAIDVVRNYFRNIYLRGDTAFSLTEIFDFWNENQIFFAFGYDRHANLVNKAISLPDYKWKRLKKKKTIKMKHNFREDFVKDRGYRNLTLVREYISEFEYSPVKCNESYRMIVVKKIIKVTEGQIHLFDEERYFFYITNIRHMSAVEVLDFIHGRCNHENKIQQLKDKDGVHALKMPAAEFNANWAYMIIGSLAWNMKSWLGLLMQSKENSDKIIRMEMRKFQNYLINIPCQIIKSGRYIIYRFLNYNTWQDDIYNTFNYIRRMTLCRP